jgi:hypothetical protein
VSFKNTYCVEADFASGHCGQCRSHRAVSGNADRVAS